MTPRHLQFDDGEEFKIQLLGIFLHELAHTRTPFPEQTREFGSVLTELLGEVGVEALS
ncbi:hypothetical protein [Haloferax volcanii]|uniref:hypothetical protein n=1 Tax=Haloferax volcanii TaxID=2246 RepID=UPI00249CB17C|nr:hypothetical protein [Haloferax alexandrinus]